MEECLFTLLQLASCVDDLRLSISHLRLGHFYFNNFFLGHLATGALGYLDFITFDLFYLRKKHVS